MTRIERRDRYSVWSTLSAVRGSQARERCRTYAAFNLACDIKSTLQRLISNAGPQEIRMTAEDA